jgi:hypothetical protein
MWRALNNGIIIAKKRQECPYGFALTMFVFFVILPLFYCLCSSCTSNDFRWQRSEIGAHLSFAMLFFLRMVLFPVGHGELLFCFLGQLFCCVGWRRTRMNCKIPYLRCSTLMRPCRSPISSSLSIPISSPNSPKMKRSSSLPQPWPPDRTCLRHGCLDRGRPGHGCLAHASGAPVGAPEKS